MKKDTWSKEFREDLDRIEKRKLVIDQRTLSEEAVTEKLAVSTGWPEPSWMVLLILTAISYAPTALVFLCGFIIGMALSLLR